MATVQELIDQLVQLDPANELVVSAEGHWELLQSVSKLTFVNEAGEMVAEDRFVLIYGDPNHATFLSNIVTIPDSPEGLE